MSVLCPTLHPWPPILLQMLWPTLNGKVLNFGNKKPLGKQEEKFNQGTFLDLTGVFVENWTHRLHFIFLPSEIVLLV